MYKRLFGFNFESIEKGRFSYDFYKISIDDGTRRLILIQLLTFNAFSFPLKWDLITQVNLSFDLNGWLKSFLA